MLARTLLLAGLVGAFAPAARADVTPHPLFTDNMVLQQGAELPVWGTASPGEKLTVAVNSPDNGVGTNAVADDTGKWSVKLPAQKAGVGYTLTIKGGNEITLKNVAVGEVWVCSGQSNMEWTVDKAANPDQVKASSANPKLRLFTVQKKATATPVTDQKEFKKYVSASWAVAGPETVGGFSAVGYHFGQYLQKHLPGDVPVGLIHTSWGGTPAEAWTSAEALEAVETLKYYNENAKKMLAQVEEGRKTYDPEKAKAAYAVAQEKYKEAVAKHKEAVEKAKAEGKPAPAAPKAPSLALLPTISPHTPATLYNAMIHPLLPFPINGAIWYQGETNAGRAYEYRTLLPTMIKDWRTKWGKDFPFVIVQLAPFQAISKEPVESAWAELREAQYLTTKALPKVGLAVITDVGDEKDIHPRQKQPVGDRLAIAALAIEYGQKVEPLGPTYKGMTVEGDKAVISFDHIGSGLEAKGEKLTGFAVAGEDKKFVNADAEIKGDKVVVSSPQVTKPVAVRFGWANYPVVNLWSKDGLPAVPFRTDDFPGVTEKATAKK